jgi:hypothetical protein
MNDEQKEWALIKHNISKMKAQKNVFFKNFSKRFFKIIFRTK